MSQHIKQRMRHTGYDRALGYVPGCRSCGHSPGEHAIPAHHGAPQPCEAAGCDCDDLVRPDRAVGGIMRNFPGGHRANGGPNRRGSKVA